MQKRRMSRREEESSARDSASQPLTGLAGPKHRARRSPAGGRGKAAVLAAPEPRREPDVAPEAAPTPRGGGHGSIEMRARVASLLRISDGIVGRAVSAYESLFDLKQGDQADIYLQIGRELLRSERLAEAQKALRTAVDLRPEDGRGWLELGRVHARLDAPAAAVDCFEKALARGLSEYELHFHLAQALTDLGRPEEALDEFEKALVLNPDAPEAHYHTGVVLDALGRLEAAVDAFENAIDISPRVVAYHQSLGFTLEGLGRRDEAIACFKRALQLERRSGSIR